MDELESHVPCTARAMQLLAGKRVRILYVDRHGRESLRWVVVKRVTSYHGYPALAAHCEMRNSERTFLLHRIRACESPDWQQVNQAEVAQIAVSKQEAIEGAASGHQLLQRRTVGAFCALFLSVVGFVYSNSNITPKSVSVSGYTRRDGAQVSSYSRRPAGSRKHDAPYEMLRGCCFFVSLGCGALLWLSASQLRRLKKAAESQ